MKRSQLLSALLIVGLVLTLATFLLTDRYEIRIEEPLRPAIAVGVDCPREVMDRHKVGLETLSGTVRAINRQARHLTRADLHIDAFQPVDPVHSQKPPEQALFSVDLTTGDGSRLVSRNHHVPFGQLDTAMAACVSRAVRDFLALRARLGTKDGPLVLRNF